MPQNLIYFNSNLYVIVLYIIYLYMHTFTYIISIIVDISALASMRMIAKKSWADSCEEAENPSKNGAE